MRKITKKTVTEVIRYCDEPRCKQKASYCCYLCEKDLCGWNTNGTCHALVDPYDNGGDYPDYYCKDCLKKGEKYMKIINECQQKENKALEDWHGECKKRK